MPAASFVRSTARTRWQREVQDTNGVYATSTIFEGLLNDAMGDWCEMVKLRRENDQIDIVANTSVYSLTGLSPRGIELIRASCPTSASATDDRVLELLTVQEANERYPNWRSDPASWPHSIIRGTEGPQSLRLYPTPASSQEASVRSGTWYASQNTGAVVGIEGLTAAATQDSGIAIGIQFLVGSLQLYYIAHSTDIDDDDTTTVETACGISPDYQDALIWYCVARFHEMDVGIAQAEKAAMYWAKWQVEVERASGLARGGMQRRPSRRVGWSNV